MLPEQRSLAEFPEVSLLKTTEGKDQRLPQVYAKTLRTWWLHVDLNSDLFIFKARTAQQKWELCLSICKPRSQRIKPVNPIVGHYGKCYLGVKLFHAGVRSWNPLISPSFLIVYLGTEESRIVKIASQSVQFFCMQGRNSEALLQSVFCVALWALCTQNSRL